MPAITSIKNFYRSYNLLHCFCFFVIILSIFFFSPIFYRQFDIGKAFVFKMGMALILICFSLWNLLKNNDSETSDNNKSSTYTFPFLIPIVFYVLIYIVSTVLSIAPRMSLLGAYERQVGLLGVLSCIGLYWFFVSSNYKNYLLIIQILLITASIISVHAVLQFVGFSIFGFDSFVYISRVGSFLGHPNLLGNLLAFSLPFHIYFIFNNTSKNKLFKLFWIISLLLQTAALFMAKTRGAYIAVFFSFVTFSFLLIDIYPHKKKLIFSIFCFSILLLLFLNSSFIVFHSKKVIPIIIGGGIFILLLFVYLFFGKKNVQLCILKHLFIFLVFSLFSFGSAYKLHSISTKDENSFAYRYFSIYDFGHTTPRYTLWRNTINTFDNVPFFGIGIETFRQFFMPHKSEELERQEPGFNYDNPHSNYLYYIVSLGPLGLLIYLWILYRFLFISFRIVTNKNEDSENRLLGLSFFICIVSYLIWSIPGFDFLVSMVYFWAIMAAFSVWFRSISHSYKFKFIEYRFINLASLKEKKQLLQKVIMISAIPACLYSGYINVKIAKADYFFMIGANYCNSNNFQEALIYFQKATEENPHESFYFQNLANLYTHFASKAELAQDRFYYVIKSEQAIKEGLKNSWAPENLYIAQLQGRILLGNENMIEETAKKALSFSPHSQLIKDILEKVTKGKSNNLQ